MPRELRSIEFFDHELVSALTSYRRVQPDFLQEGEILACFAQSSTDVNVRIVTARGRPPVNISVAITDSDFLEALIRYCLENNIPIPRAGKKSIKIRKERVALNIFLNDLEQSATEEITEIG